MQADYRDKAHKNKLKKAILLDVDYVYNKKFDAGFISLLLKTQNGIIRRFYKFDPYFLVDTKEIERGLRLLKSQNIDASAEKTERIINNEKKQLWKIITKKPSLIPKAKKILEAGLENASFYEYDIPIKKRFMIDYGIEPFNEIYYKLKDKRLIEEIKNQKEAKPHFKLMSFDIEVYNPQGVPNPDKDNIIIISYKKDDKASAISTSHAKNSAFAKDEKELLLKFDELIKEEKPDIIFGYNSSLFDFPYIEKRAKKLKIKLQLLKKSKRISKGLIKGYKLRRHIHLDLYHIARLLNIMGIIEAERLTLADLYKSLFAKDKYMLNRLEIWKYWDKGDKEDTIKYAIGDAEATFEIAKEFLPLEVELAKTAKTTLFDVSLSTAGQLVESMLMFYAAKERQLIPKKPNENEIAKRLLMPIKGGFVKLPMPGIYDNLAVLDFRGLYPSIIVSYNVDPSTIANGNEEDVFISPTGIKFKKRPIGLIPKVLDEIIEKRKEIKKVVKKSNDPYLKARSQALKILANSFYGYLGYARSRWYNRDCAESITAWGREHIKKAEEEAEKRGFEVLYIDTDSLFLLMKNKTKESVLEFIKEFNKKLPEKMELELESFYKRALFVSKKAEEKGAKKKYAMLAEDGTIKIRGFELVRRDWSDIARETQRAVLETILKEENKENALKHAISIVRDVIEKIRNGQLPIEKFIIKTQINKGLDEYEATSPELIAAKRLKSIGRDVGRGSVISYVITKKGNSISEKSYPYELADSYDPEYYIKNQILPAVMKLLKELGIKEEELTNSLDQKSLKHYF